MIVLLVATLLLGPAQFARAVFDTEDKIAILEQHNTYRRDLTGLDSDGDALPRAANMNYLVWNELLEKFTQTWADACAFAHGQPTSDGSYIQWTEAYSSSIGQNLYKCSPAGCASGNNVKSIDAFYNEVSDYHYSTDTCDAVCGHFTQVVWAKSQMVACAHADCGDSDMIVCNYYPPGNYVGQMPYVEGEPCSQCGDEDSECVTNMCVAPEYYDIVMGNRGATSFNSVRMTLLLTTLIIARAIIKII